MPNLPPFLHKIKAALKPGLRPLPAGLAFKDPHVLVATWFGAGRIKPASGTIGSLAAIPAGAFIAYFGGYFTLAIAAALLLWIGTMAAAKYGAASGQKDDQAIVVDEVVGLWIAAIPAQSSGGLWLLAFVLFRLFDIYKPWPASYFDKRAGSALDVMLDDVIAGLYAFIGVAASAYIIAMQGG